MNPLFTIGHSTHDFAKFLELLKQHRIEVVADVRSRPFSRLEWFCRPALEKELRANGLRYVFLGDELGARRVERECYIGPRADYGLIAGTPAFQQGIERLRDGVLKFRVALMCAEKDPLDCHRTVLVCRYAQEFAEIFHILSDGRLESHAAAEERMMAPYVSPEGDMFRSRIELLNDAYKRRGEEINYVEQPQTSSVVRDEPWNDES
ncbi:MAG: DUF488 domain-containing protein [Luteolibacter sp.]|nr:DUF488 domain-containing protein [Luteolibacter sp.]